MTIDKTNEENEKLTLGAVFALSAGVVVSAVAVTLALAGVTDSGGPLNTHLALASGGAFLAVGGGGAAALEKYDHGVFMMTTLALTLSFGSMASLFTDQQQINAIEQTSENVLTLEATAPRYDFG